MSCSLKLNSAYFLLIFLSLYLKKTKLLRFLLSTCFWFQVNRIAKNFEGSSFPCRSTSSVWHAWNCEELFFGDEIFVFLENNNFSLSHLDLTSKFSLAYSLTHSTVSMQTEWKELWVQQITGKNRLHFTLEKSFGGENGKIVSFILSFTYYNMQGMKKQEQRKTEKLESNWWGGGAENVSVHLVKPIPIARKNVQFSSNFRY